MCNHPLPNESKIDSKVENVNDYGKFSDSIGSVKIRVSYNCPNCGKYVKTSKFLDLRENNVS